MRRTTTCLLTGVVLLVTGWVLPAPASACSCAGEPLAGQVARADAVFTGRLLSREVGGGSSSADPALHVFAVDTVWKGSVAAEQGVVSAASGASCGLELSGDGPFLVLATRSAELDEGQLAADLCGGTAPWEPELADELQAATGSDGSAGPQPGAAGTEPAGGVRVWGLAAGAVAAGLVAGLVLFRRRAAR